MFHKYVFCFAENDLKIKLHFITVLASDRLISWEIFRICDRVKIKFIIVKQTVIQNIAGNVTKM